MKKKLAFLLAAMFVLVACGQKNMALPQAENLNAILISNMSLFDSAARIEEEAKMQEILDQLSASEPTKTESVNDSPSDGAKEVIAVHPEHKDSQEKSVLYVYRIGEEYFIEQPYEGIWKTTAQVHENLSALILDAQEVRPAIRVDGKLYFETGKEVLNGPT